MSQLRTKAVTALKLQKAGSNALLRLGLSTTPADPGLWRAQQTLHAFRRLVRKEPRLFALWKQFMASYRGDLFSGPFSQIITVVCQLGWHVDPPFLCDHDGVHHDLFSLDSRLLDSLIYDAWLQHVACQVVHRKTMDDLEGLDHVLAPGASASLDALQMSLVSALQSGAFLGAASHCRYDFSQFGSCPHCGCDDTPAHWLSCPRYDSIRQSIPGWTACTVYDTKAMTNHLLPSRSPYHKLWKLELQQISDETASFWSSPAMDNNHVFTDGSATRTSSPFDVAAWGSLNATTGELIAAAPLHGLHQGNDRAELVAVLATLKWQNRFRANADIWIDAKFVASGLAHILEHGVAGNWSNLDLWDQIIEQTHSLSGLRCAPHWIPSHLDEALVDSPFEEWIREWNDRVDHLARHANQNRPVNFWKLHRDAIAHHNAVADRLKQLRAFFFQVAAQPKQATYEVSSHVSEFDPATQFSLNDLSFSSMEQLLLSQVDQFKFPASFLLSLLRTLFDWSSDSDAVYDFSFEEFALMLAADSGFQFPFWNPHTRAMELSSATLRYERPTLSYYLSVLRQSFAIFSDLFDDFVAARFQQHNKVALGVHRPSHGVYVRLQPQYVQMACTLLIGFTATRPLRKSCDAARPV